MKLARSFVVAGIASGSLVCSADAALITYTNSTVEASGTGFGTLLNLLVLSNTGTQAGSVLWNGASDALVGDATNQSMTQSVGDVLGANIDTSSFALILNVNEGGQPKDLVVDDFELVFQDATGAELFTAAYDAPAGGITLEQVGAGQGAAGHLFLVTLSPAEKAQLEASASNRIGQRTINAFGSSSGGGDGFFIQAIPEPATLGSIAAIGLIARRRRR